jgi:protein-S-isoprenylcysteine O-methyltransferase Ste14
MAVHYHSFVLPFIPYPSLLAASHTEPHYLHNALFYLLFWAQHILMATLRYKVAWVSQWKYFPLYDRYIYNIMSGLALWVMFANLKTSYIILFEIPIWICLPLTLVGVYALVSAMKTLGNQILMPFSVKKLLNNQVLEIVPYEAKRHTSLTTKGIYGLVRHPMQAGVLLMFIFGNGVYTTDRLLFVGVMGLFVLVGVLMEEKRLCVLEKDYPSYMQQVKARFIPYLL